MRRSHSRTSYLITVLVLIDINQAGIFFARAFRTSPLCILKDDAGQLLRP